jgi:type VI secretion system secreted protein Hcp
MAVDMFLKLDDVKGESTVSKHEGEIDVLAWGWGMSQAGTLHAGTGGGSGKVSVNDISITKYVDKASPRLIISCCNGSHFNEGVLTVRKAGGKEPVEYLKITMKPVLITNVSTGGSGGEDRITEHVTLNFAEFNVVYTPQAGEGTGEGTVEAGWKIAQGAEA